MNHPIAAAHAHRGLLARQKRAILPVKDDDPVTRTVIRTVIQTAVVTPTTSARTPVTTIPVVKPTVTPSTSLTISTTSSVVVIPPKVTTTSSTPIPTPSTTSIPSTSSKPTVTVSKTPKVVTSTISVQPSATSAAANATGAKSNGGAIAGGVIGGLLGAAALGVLIFFFVRRYRRKLEAQEAFNASTFRRSALLLTDPPVPPEKDNFRSSPSAPSSFNPHQMIQVPPTSSASPYADSPYYNHTMNTQDPYGTYAAGAAHYNHSQYGTDGQLSRDPFAAANNQYGGNISGATFGHANYGQQQSHQGYYNGIPMHRSSPSPAPTPVRSPAPGSVYSHQQQYAQQPYGQQQQYAQQHHEFDNAPLPNPFTAAQAAQGNHERADSLNSLTTAAQALAAARIAAASARVGATSPSPAAALTRANSTGARAALERANSIRTGAMLARADSSTLGSSEGGHSDAGSREQWATAGQVLSRNPSSGQRSQRSDSPPPPAYQDTDGKYADLQRDVKVNPNAASASTPAPSQGARNTTAPANANAQPSRPLSSHTVYDAADAYGGF